MDLIILGVFTISSGLFLVAKVFSRAIIKKMNADNNKIKKLKDYLEKQDNVSLAFLFGSRTKNQERPNSDWDIGLYFKPDKYLELETNRPEYPKENKIKANIENILASETDTVILNRARPSLVFSVLNSGEPLSVKDEKLYLELLSKTHYEAVDYWNFVQDYRKIYEQATSLTVESKAILNEHLTFLKNELEDLAKFKELDWQEYLQNRDTRRNLERWIENIVISSIDIAKIILASERKNVPPTYRELLRSFGGFHLDEKFAETFSQFAELRNIIAHEYLDMRWQKIKNFIEQAEKLYPEFIKKVQKILDDE